MELCVLQTLMCNLSFVVCELQGSKTDPYRSSCSALESENWNMVYQRTLIRDVKTISQTVLIVKISTIGNESLVEAEPVDTTNKLKVFAHIRLQFHTFHLIGFDNVLVGE